MDDFRKELLKINNSTSIRKKPKPILCININIWQELKFSSAYKFQCFLGISSNYHILECLNGKRNSVKGWRIEYFQ